VKPLEPLAAISPIARLLKQARAAEVRTEMDRLGALDLDAAQAAAYRFARGAEGLRGGALDAALAELDGAAEAFIAIGAFEAGLLARCEAILATLRRGGRATYAGAIAALEATLADPVGHLHPRVRVVALHYRGTAERLAGDALATQETLLEAFRLSEPFLEERAQILNSLGTLYGVLGAFGAAQALLEHAAELHHQNGDAVGEAIAHGQLGSAALAVGHHERARRHLQRQEWLASSVDDTFGRARAQSSLADVALELGRPDEAAELATLALTTARSVAPPLSLWIAFATRALGRARMELDAATSPEARVHLEEARARFSQLESPLGKALTDWDLAAIHAREGQEADFFTPAWALGSLGLTARVAGLLTSLRHTVDTAPDALAAAAQAAPHLGAELEIELVYGDPMALAALAARRIAGQRNLGRLAALSLVPPGLLLAAIAAEAIGGRRRALPPERAFAAALLEIPGAVLWAFPERTAAEIVGRDLAALRVALGPDTRALLVHRPLARVLAPPFQGEVGPAMEGVDALALIAAAHALEPAALVRGEGVAWSAEAEAQAAMAGFATRATAAASLPGSSA
jgi:tetratricopeptide (TPR) repeat protein